MGCHDREGGGPVGSNLAAELRHRFKYHAPDDTKARRHMRIRELALELALATETEVPTGREQAVALTKLEEYMFWANAGIARGR